VRMNLNHSRNAANLDSSLLLCSTLSGIFLALCITHIT